MAKLYGNDLKNQIKASITSVYKTIADRQERINAGLTDLDDCFMSTKTDSNQLHNLELQLEILSNGGTMEIDGIFDENNLEVNVRWADTRYGSKLVGNGVFASSRKALLKKTGWQERKITVPAWTKFNGGSGGGMCAVFTGSYAVCRWHTNMLTGEYVGFPE